MGLNKQVERCEFVKHTHWHIVESDGQERCPHEPTWSLLEVESDEWRDFWQQMDDYWTKRDRVEVALAVAAVLSFLAAAAFLVVVLTTLS